MVIINKESDTDWLGLGQSTTEHVEECLHQAENWAQVEMLSFKLKVLQSYSGEFSVEL